LTIDAGEDMESQLLWPFYDDVFACGIPADHVMVFWAFKETIDTVE